MYAFFITIIIYPSETSLFFFFFLLKITKNYRINYVHTHIFCMLEIIYTRVKLLDLRLTRTRLGVYNFSIFFFFLVFDRT